MPVSNKIPVKPMYYVTILVMLFTLMMSSSVAKATCIRLTSEHNADTTDLKRFRQFHQWKDKTGNDLAISVWKYLCGYETGLYHFNEILEGPDTFDEYATVRDPLKILNVYNMAYCGIFGPVTDGIFQGIGFKQGRSFGLELWNHCATELWYDQGWHYFDVDVRGILVDANGIVASLDEAKRNRNLWTNPPLKIEPFFPSEQDKNKVFEIYRDSRVNYYYRWFEGSHTMDFYLRKGESFTRWWNPQGGRWNHLPRYNKTKWIKDLIQTEPVGAKPNHRDFTKWNHGNGLFHYAPDLSDASTDFADGAFVADNLIPGTEGLHLKQAGDGQVIFEVFTPYIIVAKVNDLDDLADDTEASVVTIESFLPVEASISLDNGITWEAAGAIKPNEKVNLDLTHKVKDTYGYLLKLTTSGKKSSPAIKSISIDTWVQVAPISLPRLKKGKNHLQYRLGDRYDRITIPMLVNPNTADPADLQKHLVMMPEDYNPERHTCRIKGDAILRLTAPAGMKIAWFSTGATFRTYQGQQASKTDNRIAYSVGQPEDFKEIYKSSVPTWTNHWRYNWDTDVVLDMPAEQVYVKYTGNPGLNVIRACLHLMPKQPSKTNLQIVHGFSINARLQTRTINMDKPDDYIIECEGEPENIFIEMTVPSG